MKPAMKRTALSLLVLATFTAVSAQAADLKIEVAGINDAKGEVFVALYNNADIWMKKPFKVNKATAVKGTTTLTFADLPEGDYAASVFHDEDGDRKMGRNAIGIPTEPWGFSKDVMGMFGPPSFDEAKVKVPAGGVSIVINLKS
jgi:uncharacterized protein (DUF2141 family)